MAAHRVLAGNEAADRLADAGRKRWMVPERVVALISCALSFPPESEAPFHTLADRIFWQGIKDEVGPLGTFRPGRECGAYLRVRQCPHAASRRARCGFSSWSSCQLHQAVISIVGIQETRCRGQVTGSCRGFGVFAAAVLSCGYGKTSWEIPSNFTCWSQSLVFFWSRATPRRGSSSSVCDGRATKLKFRRGGVVPPHSSVAHVWFLYRSWYHAMPMQGLDLSRRWPLAIRRRIGRIQLARNFMPCSGSGTFICQPRCQAGKWCSRTRWHRIDFVAVPGDWLAGVKRAEVETAVALPGSGSSDHAMPVVELVISPSTAGRVFKKC